MAFFPLPPHIRRAFALAIPIFTIASFWGITKGIFDIGLEDNLISTGLTLSTVLGLLNVVLLFWIFKHRVP